MKCPKCGYNTFEYLDSCKKCGKELASFKESMGIRPLVLQVAAPAVAAIGVQGSGAMPESADDKLFQWDTPEPATDSGLVEMEESGMVLGEDAGTAAEPPKDPFSFDDEFEIPLTSEQEVAPPAKEDPFGGFSLDDLGSAPEETLSEMTSPQEAVQEKPAFEGFAFEDEEISHAEEQVTEAPSFLAADDSEDIFGGFVLDESEEESGGKELVPEAEPAVDSIFGEFALDEQPATVEEEPAEDRGLKPGDDIFGEFAFEESDAISPSPKQADLGEGGVLDEKNALTADTGLGGEFSLDAFADDFPGMTGESSPADVVGSGEFDLDDFLKIEDDSKVAGEQGKIGAKSSAEDLDALFGELDLTEKK